MNRSLPPPEHPSGTGGFAARVCIAAGIVSLFALLFLVVVYATTVFVLLFAGTLVAVFLRALSDLLTDYVGLSGGWALLVVCLALVALLGLGGWLFGAQIAQQLDELWQRVPTSVEQLRKTLKQYRWGEELLDFAQPVDQFLPNRGDLVGQVTGVVSSVFNALTYFVVILFLGLFIAADPGLYQRGVLHLVPPARRERGQQVLNGVGRTLKWWLIGQLIAMVIVGLLVGLGLAFLGVPLALGLGFLAGLLEFVPYIGPIAAAIPAVLLALAHGGPLVLWVILLYVAVQSLESYVIIPIVQQQAVRLPPALTLIGMVLLGLVAGILGILIATPLVAAVMTLVKMLYVEDVLGDHGVHVPGQQQPARAR